MQAVSSMPKHRRDGLQWAFERADVGHVALVMAIRMPVS